MRQFFIALLALFFAATPSNAQAKGVAVYVAVTSEDQLGRQLGFALRERVRGSASYVEAVDADSAFVEIKLVTLDPDDLSSQSCTIYSWTIVVNLGSVKNTYLTSSVGICGRSKIDECAGSLFRTMGVEVDGLREALVQEIKRRQP